MKADRRGVFHGVVPTARLTRSSLQYYIEAVGITGQRVAGSGTKGMPNIVELKAGPAPRPDITKPPVPKDPPVPGYRAKLYGFMGSTALTVVSFVVGGILSYNAREKAQDMANAGIISPRQTYDPALQKLEKQGKALDAGAIVCYVVGTLALGTTAYLAYDLWIKKRKERALPSRGIPVGRGVTITPTFSPKGLGLSGGFSF